MSVSSIMSDVLWSEALGRPGPGHSSEFKARAALAIAKDCSSPEIGGSLEVSELMQMPGS